jgi:2-C-methyl-D-erythritol 4-phosphate cytidylyltransferase
VPVVAVTDTIRRTDASGALIETVDRSTLVAMQTPQGFARAVLVAAHACGIEDATDDAALAEANGAHLTAIAGADESFKITTPLDLVLADAFVSGSRA